MTDWWWVPSQYNMADLVTRECSPEQLDGDSLWQRGPKFLTRSLMEWPMKSVAEVASGTREVVSKLQRKAFSAIITRAQAKRLSTPGGPSGVSAMVGDGATTGPSPDDNMGSSPSAAMRTSSTASNVHSTKTLWGSVLVGQVDLLRFSTLTKLCGAVGYVRRAVRSWLLDRSRTGKGEQWEAVLTVQECKEAFQDLCLAAQTGVSFPTTTLNRLVVNKDNAIGLLLCHGRIQSIDEERPGVPLIPYKERISTLPAEEAHPANHEGISGTLLWMRKRAWVVQGPRVARKVIDACVHCQRCSARLCTQVMSGLPLVRTRPAAPFV